MLVKIATTIDCGGIPKGQILETIRKVRQLGHCRAAFQNRNNGNVSLKSGLYFDANGVSVIKNSRTSGRPAPVGSDYSQQDVILEKRVLNLLPKIKAKGNAINIHIYGVTTVMVREAVANAPRNNVRVRTPV
jgi:hypothetical protein